MGLAERVRNAICRTALAAVNGIDGEQGKQTSQDTNPASVFLSELKQGEGMGG